MIESPRSVKSSAFNLAKLSSPECVTSSAPAAQPPTKTNQPSPKKESFFKHATSSARQVETECVIRIIWAKLNNTEDSLYNMYSFMAPL